MDSVKISYQYSANKTDSRTKLVAYLRYWRQPVISEFVKK